MKPKLSRQARYQRKHKLLGLCRACSARAVTRGGHCLKHHLARSIRARERYRLQHGGIATYDGPPRVRPTTLRRKGGD